MSLSSARKHSSEPKVDINIVPLVDVALVLLIIFMVTATFVKASGVKIKLPTSSATKALQEDKRELVIGVTDGGSLLWNGSVVSDAQLGEALAHEAQTRGVDSRVTVQGDTKARHGDVVRAMSIAQQAGFGKLVIATKQEVSNGNDD